MSSEKSNEGVKEVRENKIKREIKAQEKDETNQL